MNSDEFGRLILTLCSLPEEVEWVEFKHNNVDADQIGQYISALANTAALLRKTSGFLIWGVEDGSHDLLGTTFKYRQASRGNQTLELFLTMNLTPRLDFRFFEGEIAGKEIVLLEVPTAVTQPVRWKDKEFIRVSSSKIDLREVPEKERELWRIFSLSAFETGIACTDISAATVLNMLDYPAYFGLLQIPIPASPELVLNRLESEDIVRRNELGSFDITNMGAMMLAKALSAFAGLRRKAVRVVVYDGRGRVKTLRERVLDRGFGVGFEELVSFIDSQLPATEEIGQALRHEVHTYPEIAVREIVANALIHQDFTITGAGPMVEIFSDRIEVSNPGLPLIDTLRFIDERRSRNEKFAEMMRLCNICEERGSGVDKVISAVERFELPPPEFSRQSEATVVRLFSPRPLTGMNKTEKTRACYQHTCLQYVTNSEMTNSTLRKRFGISEQNYSMASRIIGDTIQQGWIKQADAGNTSRRLSRYVPFWA
jgi:ATP-dependent DNA helicase RecG